MIFEHSGKQMGVALSTNSITFKVIATLPQG